MKVSIKDSQTLSAVTPKDLKNYLSSQGWVKSEDILTKASVWTLSGEEVIVLNSREYADYHLRISEVLAKLEQVESRSQIEIIHDIYFSNFDVIRLHNHSSAIHNGSIPYEEGLEFNAGAKDLIFSAACSAAIPKPYYATRRPHKAETFMKNVRLGQTEQGSYVLTVLNQILPPQHGEYLNLFSNDPFQRVVTKFLSVGIESISSAVESFQETGSTEILFSGIKNGVSANMCDAISRVAATSNGNGVEVSINWARNIQSPEKINNHVFIPSRFIPAIEAMSQILKEKQPEEDYHMQGVVIRLQRNQGEATGTVTVLDIGSGTPRRISIELSGEQYALAVEAHKKSLPIQCVGEIVRKGRKNYLVNQGQLFLLKGPASLDILD